MTQAAWGRRQGQKSALFVMNNYELGLVLLPKNYVNYHNGALKKGGWNETMIADDFVKHVDLGFQLPLIKYSGDDMPFFCDKLVVFFTSTFFCLYYHNLITNGRNIKIFRL